MKKLSKPMQRVIDLMAEGWDCCVSRGYTSSVFLQKDGCGRGGKSEKVNSNTFSAIYERGLVREHSTRYPTTIYVLSYAGKELANAPDPTSSKS